MRIWIIQRKLFLHITMLILFHDQVWTNAEDNKKDLTRMLELIEEQVGNTPPNFNDAFPTEVECELYVDSFDSINEANMDFTVSIFIHLMWQDLRFLTWLRLTDNNSYIEADSKRLANLWVPDLYFPNEKKAFFHNVFMPNKMLRIFGDGKVSYTARLSLTLSCPMDLHHYPFDEQQCPIIMESFSYDENNIIMKWIGENTTDGTEDAVQINREITLPQFEVYDIASTSFKRERKGSYARHSGLRTDFYLARNIGYYVVQMYIPSILVVMLSWISFWLNVNAVPGRISLGVLTVLTMTTQSSSVNASLPRVSYTKAIDIWMSVCLLFVFAALIEFAVANVLSNKDNNKGLKVKSMFHILKPGSKKKKPKTEILVGEDGEMRLDPERDPTIQRKKVSGMVFAMYLDVASRFLFPFFFALFNLVYWAHYLSTS
ncbi:glycine receptor subunit alpha-2-like [Pecten maximus]|uniref:glycine receptor subunit alpha-2-like n=1 Tax=Pecten maximus TaxID=6579 RepID=UPI001458DD5A|nr:glycine receptor subunit alpha-2-like [Pecten maximus]